MPEVSSATSSIGIRFAPNRQHSDWRAEVMPALTNLQTPNAGADPEAIVGRDDQEEMFVPLLARLARGRMEQSIIITGLRGVGKTVLLGVLDRLVEAGLLQEVTQSQRDRLERQRRASRRSPTT